MPSRPKVEVISRHRMLHRNYTPEEMAAEVSLLVKREEFVEFVFIASGPGIRATRMGSSDGDLRTGDVFVLLRLIEDDLLELY